MSIVAELVEVEPDRHYEVVDGEVVENEPMGIRQAFVISRLDQRIGRFADDRGLGRTAVEALFRLDPEGRLKRRPDLAFVSHERWPIDREDPDGAAMELAPDLAVEVVSPTNSADEIMRKLHEYLDAGVRLVWVIYPAWRLIYVYHSADSVRILTEAGTLDGGDVLPGFRVPLSELFGPRKAPG